MRMPIGSSVVLDIPSITQNKGDNLYIHSLTSALKHILVHLASTHVHFQTYQFMLHFFVTLPNSHEQKKADELL